MRSGLLVDRIAKTMLDAPSTHILQKAVSIFMLCGAIAACATPRAQFTAAQAEKAQPLGFPHVRAFADSAPASVTTVPGKLET
jgi:hypothetical protein